ncbi:hypothetical protein AYI69_g7541 [Smittium culicis]|uniref:Uncharacterized protein n=1 Tax=Smittium culicis TaxID=133412 RepID=A0A1R1XR78_9FUNG|nr:hypothetical protein AYI69_g7541 [Smittium culicis]
MLPQYITIDCSIRFEVNILFPIKSLSIPIFLRLPWLKLHNPTKTKNENKIKFKSDFYKQEFHQKMDANTIFGPSSDYSDESLTDSEEKDSASFYEDEFFDTKSKPEEINST